MLKKVWRKIVNYYRFKAIIKEVKRQLERGRYHHALMVLDETEEKHLGLFDNTAEKEKLISELRQKALKIGAENKIYHDVLYETQYRRFKSALNALDGLEKYLARQTKDKNRNFPLLNVREVILKYIENNNIWRNINQDELPQTLPLLRKFICETGMYYEMADIKKLVTPDEYKRLLASLQNIELYVRIGNLKVEDCESKKLLEEVHRRACRLGLVYELTQAIDALIRAEGMARKINFPRRELELLREKIEYIQGRAEPNLKNIETVGY